jgi:hypothetical protein
VSRLRKIARPAWEFVVGDDWRTALGVSIAIALTALIAQTGVAAWWVMPVSVLLVLAISIRRAVGGPPR